eukprot:52639_1
MSGPLTHIGQTQYSHLNARHQQDIDSGIDITKWQYIESEHQFQLNNYIKKYERERKKLEEAMTELNINNASISDIEKMHWKDERLVIIMRITNLYHHTKIHRMGKTLIWLQQVLELDHAQDVAEQLIEMVAQYGESSTSQSRRPKRKKPPKSMFILFKLSRGSNVPQLIQSLETSIATYNSIDTKLHACGKVRAQAGHTSRITLQNRSHNHRLIYTVENVQYILNKYDQDTNLTMIQTHLEEQCSSTFPGKIERMVYRDGRAQPRLSIEITAQQWTFDHWKAHFQVQMDARMQMFLHINANQSYLLSCGHNNECDISETKGALHRKHIEFQWNKYIQSKENPSNAYFLLTRTERRTSYHDAFLNCITPQPLNPTHAAQAMAQLNHHSEEKITEEVRDSDQLDRLNLKMQIECTNMDVYHRTVISCTQELNLGGNQFKIIMDPRIEWHPNCPLPNISDTDKCYLFMSMCLRYKKAVLLQLDDVVCILNLINTDANTITNLQFAQTQMIPPTDNALTDKLVAASREIVQRLVQLVRTKEANATSSTMSYPTSPNPTMVQYRVSRLTGRLGNLSQWIDSVKIRSN